MKKKDKKISKVKQKGKKNNNISNFLKNIFKVNGKGSFRDLLKNILLPLLGGFFISYLTKGSMTAYNSLKKPVFTPPDIVFPIAWTILYLFMGIAAYRIYMNNKQGKKDNNAYFYYLIQLALNFLWSIVFFNLRLYGVSFILIIVLLVLIIITTVKFFKIDKIAGILMVPYILWVSYASLLTYFIWMYNEM